LGLGHYLCSDKLQLLGLPQLDGQEQAMYYWFYRLSYGYGYSACAMADATLMKKLGEFQPSSDFPGQCSSSPRLCPRKSLMSGGGLRSQDATITTKSLSKNFGSFQHNVGTCKLE
jgi:hypothetical protein